MCNALENSMLWRVINLTPLIVFLFVLKEIKTWRVICEFMLLLSLFGVGGAVLAYQKIIDVNDQNFFENWHIFSIFCIAWLVIVVGFLVYQSSLNTLRRRFLIYLLILTCELYIGIAVGNMFGKELNTPGVIITTSPPPMGFI